MEWNIENSYNSLTFRNWSNFESKYPICSCIDSKQKKKEKKKRKKKQQINLIFLILSEKIFLVLVRSLTVYVKSIYPIYRSQNVTQGQFLSGVKAGLKSVFFFSLTDC